MDDLGNPDNDMMHRQQAADREAARRADGAPPADETHGVIDTDANTSLADNATESAAETIEGDVRATGGLWSATQPGQTSSTEKALRQASRNGEHDDGTIVSEADRAGPAR